MVQRAVGAVDVMLKKQIYAALASLCILSHKPHGSQQNLAESFFSLSSCSVFFTLVWIEKERQIVCYAGEGTLSIGFLPRSQLTLPSGDD